VNRELEKLFKTYLGLEQAYDTSGYLRPTLFAFKDEYVRAVRQGFDDLLLSHELTTRDYERLTGIEFDNEELLYEYLHDVYRYLFEDQRDQPAPPD
jgi:hypothetical protein